MRMFKGPREPLHASIIRFFGLLSKVDGKMSKSEIRNLMLLMKMNLKTKKLCSPKCTDNKITFASIWTFKLLVPSNQNFIQTFIYCYGMVLHSFQCSRLGICWYIWRNIPMFLFFWCKPRISNFPSWYTASRFFKIKTINERYLETDVVRGEYVP